MGLTGDKAYLSCNKNIFSIKFNKKHRIKCIGEYVFLVHISVKEIQENIK